MKENAVPVDSFPELNALADPDGIFFIRKVG